jgi:hypothetical protein
MYRYYYIDGWAERVVTYLSYRQVGRGGGDILIRNPQYESIYLL